MPRFRRALPRFLLALTLAVLGLAVAVLEPVDHRPHPGTAYHAATVARLRDLPAPALDPAPLQAGFGRAGLIPIAGPSGEDPAPGRFGAVPLAGYGSRRGRPAEGVRDALEVRAAALRAGAATVVFVAVEALIIPPEVAERAAARLRAAAGLARAQLYLGATHTHAGPGGWGDGWIARQFAGPFVPGVREWLADRIVAAATAALADLRPARLGHGRFAAPDLVRHRLLGPLGRLDPEFSLLRIERDGIPGGVIGAYAAHATVLGADVMAFAGDYPGAWSRALEKATGGTALFLSGAVGSHGPAAPARGLDGADRMGRELAARTLAALPGIPLRADAPLAASAVAVELPEPQVRVSEWLRLRPWLAGRLLPWRGPVPVQAVRVGGAVWLSTPCDFSGELALEVKDFCRARGLDAVVTSFNGAYIGYVLPGRHYALPGYEPRTMSFFGPQVPELLLEVLRELAAPLAPGS